MVKKNSFLALSSLSINNDDEDHFELDYSKISFPSRNKDVSDVTSTPNRSGDGKRQ